jgi:uncharacterized protein
VTNLTLSRYVVASDRLTRSDVAGAWRVLFSTRSGAVLQVADALWSELCSDLPRGIADDVRDRLVSAGMLVPAEVDELAEVIADNQLAIARSGVLYQVVQPTAWCQLDCGYCGQEHAGQHLSETAQEQLLARIDQRLQTGTYEQLEIGWFGAEPLAGLLVLRRLTPKLRALAAHHGCTYTARIVTNGLALAADRARELVDLGITEAEITLDGLAPSHDRRRPTKTGAGTWDRIFAHVRTAAATPGLQVVVRCNVDRHNVDDVAPLVQALADAGLAGTVRFYTSPVYSWGNDAHADALTPERYAALELEWMALQMRLGFAAGLVPPRRRIVCLSVQRDGEVVDAYGTTFNCTEAPYVPAYGTPNVYALTFHRTGEEPSAARAEPLQLRHFNEAVLDGSQPACASCRMLPVCGGHCPKAWQEGHPPCPPARLNMAERLNLLFALQYTQG